MTGIGWVLKGSRYLAGGVKSCPVGALSWGNLREGPILMGRDKQKRQVHGRQCEPTGVLAPLGGLGGQVPPVRN